MTDVWSWDSNDIIPDNGSSNLHHRDEPVPLATMHLPDFKRLPSETDHPGKAARGIIVNGGFDTLSGPHSRSRVTRSHLQNITKTIWGLSQCSVLLHALTYLIHWMFWWGKTLSASVLYIFWIVELDGRRANLANGQTTNGSCKRNTIRIYFEMSDSYNPHTFVHR